jgi:hypothetical protein
VFAVADRSAASAGHRQYELRPPLLQTLDVGVSVLQGRVGWSWDHDRSFRRRRWCSDGGWQATNAGDGAAVRSVTGAATRASSVHRGGGELRRERKARMRSRGEIFASWRRKTMQTVKWTTGQREPWTCTDHERYGRRRIGASDPLEDAQRSPI